jgi:hypothetical protein
MEEIILRKILIVFSLLSLCSCTHFEQDKEVVKEQAKKDAKQVEANVTKNAMRVADNVRDSVKRTNDRVRDWWITPLPSNAKQPMPTRYCYKVLQDILCYRQQMAGWENKLVAYQGADAQPPTPATMKLLPLRDDGANVLPENRAASAKPVFAEMPAEVKEAKDSTNATEPVIIDPSHETLPESALSPQL